GIGQRNWNRVGRQRGPGDRIARQPFNPVAREPASCRYMPKPSWPAFRFHRRARRFGAIIQEKRRARPSPGRSAPSREFSMSRWRSASLVIAPSGATRTPPAGIGAPRRFRRTTRRHRDFMGESLKSRPIATSFSGVALRKRSRASTGPPLSIVSGVRWIGTGRTVVRDRDGKRANPNGSRSAGAVLGQTIRSNPRTDGQDLGDPVRLDNGAYLHLDP